MMSRMLRQLVLAATALSLPANALAVVPGEVRRIDRATAEITWQDSDPVTVYVADRPDANLRDARPVARGERSGKLTLPLPAGERRYILLRDGGDGRVVRMAERVLPLEQGSNFRDAGGYVAAGGKRVTWGRIYRSGAMPLLTEADYALLGKLGIATIVDLRSLDERMIAPTMLDDRTGALFVSNDYSLKGLMGAMNTGDGEYLYRGIGKMLAPQYRAIFRSLLANDGAVLFHCSAGQDRTGVATALIYSALGVPREQILADYHLSTALRRPLYEMPPLNPADWPGNPIVPYYVAAQNKPGGAQAEPLYTRRGNSHLAQFFEMIDKEYGSVEGYLIKELQLTPADLKRLRTLYLD